MRRNSPHQILNTKPTYSNQCGVGKLVHKLSANKNVGVRFGVKRREKIESLSSEHMDFPGVLTSTSSQASSFPAIQESW